LGLAILLVDPPVGQWVYHQTRKLGLEYSGLEYSDKKNSPMSPFDVSKMKPYQGGYRDFTATGVSASKTSIFDNIVHYWTYTRPSKDSKDSSPEGDPLESANYAKKIVAAMWINALEYIQMRVGQLECALEDQATEMRLSLKKDKIPPKDSAIEWIMKATTHAYKLKRRCLQFSHDMDNNMTELDLHLDSREKDAQDWIYIKNRLKMWTHRAKVDINAISALKSLIEASKTEKMTENTLAIQWLGTIYLPLSLTAGLLSMVDNFTPGQSRFWIYWAISLPLLFLSFALSSMLTSLWGWVKKPWLLVLNSRNAPCRDKQDVRPGAMKHPLYPGGTTASVSALAV
jgi:hypothetical protein